MPLPSLHARSDCHLYKATGLGYYKSCIKKAAIYSPLRGIHKKSRAKATLRGN